MSPGFENTYKNLLKECISEGVICKNRTGVDTYKLFNKSINIDLSKGFPIVTGKKIFFKKALAEFKWIYEGKTDLKFLHDNNIYWWDDFAIKGKLGKVYGYQISSFNGIFNQIEYVIKEIKNNSRRAVITLWNPTDLKDQSLPCCYTQFNFVRQNDNLNMVMTFRSSDLFLGLPYDIIVGALFLITIAKKLGLNPLTLGLNLADAHIYKSHIPAVNKYLMSKMYALPKIKGSYKDYSLCNYKHGEYIKADLIK
jgi:thymidylate synthase|tara:strand:- start:11523 stop:12281 length:759 start_codon:yes stop_codon:yes gene_type:complete